MNSYHQRLAVANAGQARPLAMFVCLFVIVVGRRHQPMQREYKTAESEVDGPKVIRGGGYAQLVKRCM